MPTTLPEFTAEKSLGRTNGSYYYINQYDLAFTKGGSTMEESEVREQSMDQPNDVSDIPVSKQTPGIRTEAALFPQGEDGACDCDRPGGKCICGSAADSNPDDAGMAASPYVYALGMIDPRFPSLGVEKEFAQAAGRIETAGLTDRQTFHEVLSKNRYLARLMCWVLTIQGQETYIMQPRDPMDLDLLVEALRPEPNPDNIDVVVGVLGPIAPPEMCNGLMVPIAVFDQIYSFDRGLFIQAIPRPEKITAKLFPSVAEEVFDRIMQMTDNAGTGEHRSLNYLALRYPAIYAKAAEMFERNFSLTAVEVHPSLLSGTRIIDDVIFSYTHRDTDFNEKFFVPVDRTEEYPFLFNKLSQYLDR